MEIVLWKRKDCHQLRYWDSQSKTSYIFNAEKKSFPTYDDEKPVKLKCDYIKKNKLAGTMFW